MFKTKEKNYEKFLFPPVGECFLKKARGNLLPVFMERFSAWRQAPPFDTLGLHKERKPLCRLRFFLKTPAKVGGCGTGARHTPCAIFFGGVLTPPYRKKQKAAKPRPFLPCGKTAFLKRKRKNGRRFAPRACRRQFFAPGRKNHPPRLLKNA